MPFSTRTATAFFLRSRKVAAEAARLQKAVAAWINVTEVVDIGSVLETSGGIVALHRELFALKSAEALPF
ncbi:hypothetical protein FVE85_8723 [Porphyridium purpureum]|uniref:Uncharacterized protein n=1 Tax=Porphyridium purpureum TaxID=35688 RepID=A0A5J4YPP4_PORPP|nr:hypothetical protein FVE85_8723 [Porphyridium purpureum]|eukprot:POR5827..scf296_7